VQTLIRGWVSVVLAEGCAFRGQGADFENFANIML